MGMDFLRNRDVMHSGSFTAQRTEGQRPEGRRTEKAYCHSGTRNNLIAWFDRMHVVAKAAKAFVTDIPKRLARFATFHAYGRP
jgi:hypothetical protein